MSGTGTGGRVVARDHDARALVTRLAPDLDEVGHEVRALDSQDVGGLSTRAMRRLGEALRPSYLNVTNVPLSRPRDSTWHPEIHSPHHADSQDVWGIWLLEALAEHGHARARQTSRITPNRFHERSRRTS